MEPPRGCASAVSELQPLLPEADTAYEADCVAVDPMDSGDHPDDGEEEHSVALGPPAETPVAESLAATVDGGAASSQAAA